MYNTWCLTVSTDILNIPDIPNIPEFPLFLKFPTFQTFQSTTMQNLDVLAQKLAELLLFLKSVQICYEEQSRAEGNPSFYFGIFVTIWYWCGIAWCSP